MGEEDHRERVSRALRGVGIGGHAYPHDLARLVIARWSDLSSSDGNSTLPNAEVLERLLSVCYQASLLREEGRPLSFRVALGDSDAFSMQAGPPGGLHRLLFARCRPFTELELRRLAPAAGFHRSLIGARCDPALGIEIWGIIHSGPRWLQAVRGGRDIRQVIPSVLMVAVAGPGRVLVSRGTETIGELRGGALAGHGMDVLEASWMTELLTPIREAQQAEHQLRDRRHPDRWAMLEPAFGTALARHVLRRVLATIRGARHGGTLLVVPGTRAADVLADGNYIALKYKFQDEEPRRRILSLTVHIMSELARAHAAAGASSSAGWRDYEASNDPALAVLDEALFEAAHLIAGLAEVDGAVVLTDAFDLLGFGGEISGALPEVTRVASALDLEGRHRQWVSTDRVGTRHRSVYRLCRALHDVVGVVVSQDGGLRFVRWHEDAVTYWDQMATGPWEV